MVGKSEHGGVGWCRGGVAGAKPLHKGGPKARPPKKAKRVESGGEWAYGRMTRRVRALYELVGVEGKGAFPLTFHLPACMFLCILSRLKCRKYPNR